MTYLSKYTLIGFSIGAFVGFMKAYADEVRYHTDMSIPRRAGTVPLPFWVVIGVIQAGIGGLLGAILGPPLVVLVAKLFT